jgi:hypothetical protein
MLSITIPGVVGGVLAIMEARRITLRHTPVSTDHRRIRVFMDRRPTVAVERRPRFTRSATAAVAVLLPVVIHAVTHAVQAVRPGRVPDRLQLAR